MTVTPIRKDIVVEAPQERAFRVFTQSLDAWWPRDFHIGRTPMKRAIMEPKEGGRWYEIGDDGAECEWGKVLVWEPPRRVVLAWQISSTWQYDASLITEVEVVFTAEGVSRTHVTLEHRQLERYADAAHKTSLDGGWDKLLGDFAKTAASA